MSGQHELPQSNSTEQLRATIPAGGDRAAEPMQTTEQGCCSVYQRPQFNLRFMALAISLVAVWLALWPVTTLASKLVTAIILLTFLFGCWQTRRSVLAITPPLFLPFSWMLFKELDSGWLYMFRGWSLITLLIFFSLVMLGRVNRTCTVVAATIALLYSIIASLFFYAAYLT